MSRAYRNAIGINRADYRNVPGYQRAQQLVAVALLVALLPLVSGCATLRTLPGAASAAATRWCPVYLQGSAYVTTFMPALAGLADGNAELETALLTFQRVNGPIVAFCMQRTSGTKFTDEEIAGDMAAGTHALTSLIDINERAAGMAPPAAGRSRGVRVSAPPVAAPSTAELRSSLLKVEAEALDVASRR